jgi:hypothetical protein
LASAVNPSFSAESESSPLEFFVRESSGIGWTSGESARSATGAPRGCAAPAVAALSAASAARAEAFL